jgi:hypothetical protein
VSKPVGGPLSTSIHEATQSFRPGDGEKCAVCGKPVSSGDWVTSAGKDYHVRCIAELDVKSV